MYKSEKRQSYDMPIKFYFKRVECGIMYRKLCVLG